jgi:hypothetical protein
LYIILVISTFKEQIMIGNKVKAYRNLNKEGFFSIKGKDESGKERVLGYSENMIIKNVTFTGGHSVAQAKIQSGEDRSVHAYAVGTLMSVDAIPSHYLNSLIEVTYTPKTRAGFYIKSSGIEVTEADAVILTDCKMYAKNPR